MKSLCAGLGFAWLTAILLGCPGGDAKTSDAGRGSAGRAAGGSGGQPDGRDAGDSGTTIYDGDGGSSPPGAWDGVCPEVSRPTATCDATRLHEDIRILESDDELSRAWYERERGNAAGCVVVHENFYCAHDVASNTTQCSEYDDENGVGAPTILVVWDGRGCEYTGEVFVGDSPQGEKIATIETVSPGVVHLRALTSEGIAIARNSDDPDAEPELAQVTEAYCVVAMDTERDEYGASTSVSLCEALE
jgi:hypothetical protein